MYNETPEIFLHTANGDRGKRTSRINTSCPPFALYHSLAKVLPYAKTTVCQTLIDRHGTRTADSQVGSKHRPIDRPKQKDTNLRSALVSVFQMVRIVKFMSANGAVVKFVRPIGQRPGT